MGWQDAPLVEQPKSGAQPAWMSAPTVTPEPPTQTSPEGIITGGRPLPLPGEAPQPQPAPEPSFLQKATGAIEAALSVASSVTNAIPGAIAGGLGATMGAINEGVQGRAPLADINAPPTIGNKVRGAIGAIVDAAQEGAQQATYQPRTAVGQEYAQKVGQELEPVVGAMGPAGAVEMAGVPHEAVAARTAPVARAVEAAPAAVRDAAASVAPGAVRSSAEVAADAQRAAKLAEPENQGIADALAAGYKVTQKAGKGGAVAQALESAAGRPQLARELAAHNAENTARLARQDIGLPEDTPVTPENVAKVRKEAGKDYAVVQNVGQFDNDAQYHSDLDKIVAPYETVAAGYPESKALDNPIIKVVDGLRVGSTNTAAAIEQVKFLRNEAEKAARTGDNKLAGDYRNAAQAVDNAMGRALDRMVDQGADPALGQAVDKYRAARKLIAKTYLLDDAMTGKPGEVNAMAYARAAARGAPLDGPAAQIANFGKQFGGEGLAAPKSKAGGAGPHGLDLLMAALRGGPSLAGDILTAGARPAVRALLGSEAVQGRLAARARGALPGRGAVEQALEEQPPELTTSPGAAPEGGAPPAPAPASPLGDLTPDWETSPGAAPPPAAEALPAEGLHPALGETPPSTGTRGRPARTLQIPAVPGRPGLPDVMVAGSPAEVGATEAAGAAMQTPEAVLARQQQGVSGERLPTGEATEIQPENVEPAQAPPEPIPVGEATEHEPVPAGEATELEISPEQLQAWRQRHQLGAADEARAMQVAQALKRDPDAVHAAARKFENKPAAFEQEIARINAGEGHATQAEPAAGGSAGLAHPPVQQTAVSGAARTGSEGHAAAGPSGPPIGNPGESQPQSAGAGAASRAAGQPKTGSGPAYPTEGGAASESPSGVGGAVKSQPTKPPAGAADNGGAGGNGRVLSRLSTPAGDVKIVEKPDGTGFLAVDAEGNEVGHLNDNLKAGQAKLLDENANVSNVLVNKEFRGTGVGQALYKAFEQKHEGRILPSGQTTTAAWKVWKRNYPEKVDKFVEMEVQRVKEGASPNLVIRNVTDPDVRGRVADGVTEWLKSGK